MEIDKKEYGKYVKQVTPVHNTWKNLWRAFLVGGLICMLGQVFTSVYMSFGIEKESAAAWTTLSLIGLSVILTGFHVYQKIVKFGGAGALVPITGFANSVVSPAIEYKAEGHVFGIGCKIFTIAGPVILYGILASWVLGMVKYFWRILVNEPAGTYNGERRCGGCGAYEQRQHGISGGKREISIDLYAHKKSEYFLRPEAGETDVGAWVLFEDAGVGA